MKIILFATREIFERASISRYSQLCKHLIYDNVRKRN